MELKPDDLQQSNTYFLMKARLADVCGTEFLQHFVGIAAEYLGSGTDFCGRIAIGGYGTCDRSCKPLR